MRLNHVRGQAIAETAIVASLVGFLMLAIVFAAREQVMSERLQGALYTTSGTFNASQAEVDWSSASIFTNLHGANGLGISNGACGAPSTNIIAGQDQAGDTGGVFFAPQLSKGLNSCAGQQLFEGGFPSGEPALVLLSTTVGLSNATNTHATGNAFLDNLQSNVSVSTTTFRAGDAKSMIYCFPDVGRVLSNTFQPTLDTTSSTSFVKPLPASLPFKKLKVKKNCSGTPGY